MSKIFRVVPKLAEPQPELLDEVVIRFLRPEFGIAINATRPKKARSIEDTADWARVGILFFGWHPTRQEPKSIRLTAERAPRRQGFHSLTEFRAATATAQAVEPQEEFSLRSRVDNSIAILSERLLPKALKILSEYRDHQSDWSVELILEFRSGHLFSSMLSQMAQFEDWKGFCGKKIER